jgi:hypothetical protein
MTVTKYQVMRKRRSEEKLTRLGFVVNEAFPLLPAEAEVQTRSAREVAQRALSIYNLLGVIFYEKPEKVVEWSIEEGLWGALTPKEKEIFSIPISDDDDEEKAWKMQSLRTNMLTWRIEGLLVLLWSLGKVDKLELPIEKLDPTEVQRAVPELGSSLQEFIETARLRPLTEILDQIDLHYRIYWAMSEAEQQGELLPLNFDSYILYERLHAFSWLARFEEDWDD